MKNQNKEKTKNYRLKPKHINYIKSGKIHQSKDRD